MAVIGSADAAKERSYVSLLLVSPLARTEPSSSCVRIGVLLVIDVGRATVHFTARADSRSAHSASAASNAAPGLAVADPSTVDAGAPSAMRNRPIVCCWPYDWWSVTVQRAPFGIVTA